MVYIAKPLKPLGQPIDRIMPPSFIEVVRSQLVIWFLAREHVKDTDHDGVGDRHDRALLPPKGSGQNDVKMHAKAESQ